MIGSMFALMLASTISLKEAEDIALESNTAIRFAAENVKQHNYQRIQSLLSWFPEVKFGSMYAKLQKSQKISSHQRQTHLFSNQFELIQPIFSPSLLGDLNLSKIAYEGAVIASDTTINETLLQVRSLYLSAVQNERKLQSERQRISYLKRCYEAEQKKQTTGSGTPFLVSQAKVNLSHEITAYYNTLKETGDAKRELLLLLRVDPSHADQFILEHALKAEDYPLLVEKLAQLKSSIEVDMNSPQNLDQPLALFSEGEIHEWIGVARKYRPELRKSETYVKAAQEKSRQSKTQYLPTISAFADYGYYQPINGQFFRQRNDFAGGIQLSWSLFDSFKREFKILEISALKKAAGLALQYENDRIAVTIKNDLHQIEEKLFFYLSAEENADLAAQALEEIRVRLTLGTAKELDLENSEQLMTQAVLKKLEAESALLESYFQLRYDSGIDLKIY
jgi:outer membrane protein TolC